jgi:PleD family two-component response regulator
MARRSANPLLYRILAVGRDVSRLSSGANVLTQAGYIADLVLSADQAVRRVLLRPYHLAIVSSTFTRDEQIAIRSRLKQLRQYLPVLLLGPEHDSPDAFLAAVAECLKQKKKFHFGTRLDGPAREHGTE